MDRQKAGWAAVIGVLGAICLSLICVVVPGVPAMAPAMAGLALSGTALIGCRSSGQPPLSTMIICGGILVDSIWATWTATVGLSAANIGALAVINACGLVITITARPEKINAKAAAEAKMAAETAAKAEMVEGAAPVRDRREVEIEALLRTLTKTSIVVTSVADWDQPENGMDVRVDLPDHMTSHDLASHADDIASARTLRLPRGCVVTVNEGEYQCEATISIMKRDCLADQLTLDVDTTPASINDEFDLLRTPRGTWKKICLRIESMIVGGTTGSGKTTLLHRIIAQLARCTDALIWVVDLNGGGLGAVWTTQYEQGLAIKPTVDWLADNTAEAALLLACAHEVACARKTDVEIIEMKKIHKTNVLPVSARKPAIIVIVDEGGEVRQALDVLGRVVCDRISRLAQIGREQAVRVIASVLRGTSGMLDKSLRTMCAIRVCLRMNEEGEADHILGRNPGRQRLRHTGSGWLYRGGIDTEPLIARTVDVTPEIIDEVSRHTAMLRPRLDKAARNVCANITLSSVFDGMDPKKYPDECATPQLQDVRYGLAYEGRWERRLARLEARANGLSVETAGPDRTGLAPTPTVKDVARSAGAGSAKVSDWCASVGRIVGQDDTSTVADVDEFDALVSDDHFRKQGANPKDHPEDRTQPQPVGEEDVPHASNLTLREHITMILDEEMPEGLTSGQIKTRLDKREVRYTSTNLYAQLNAMVDTHGQAERHGSVYYRVNLS